jgi:lysophospholipase L1-like esterase
MIVAVVATLLTGCAVDELAPRSDPTRTSSSSARTSAPDTALSVVGLGDSIPGGLGCAAPCRPYVEVYGDLAAAALGRSVVATNLASNSGLESGQLLKRVKSEPAYRDAVAKADVVTLTVGFNDWQGRCTSATAKKCLKRGREKVRQNLDGILQQIASLRAGRPTAVRVTGYYNMNIGNPNTPEEWDFADTPAKRAAFEKTFAAALAEFNTMTCEVAQANGAVCVDLVPAINGSRGDQDAGDLLGPDHLHPSEAGHARIANAIGAVGYAPLG